MAATPLRGAGSPAPYRGASSARPAGTRPPANLTKGLAAPRFLLRMPGFYRRVKGKPMAAEKEIEVFETTAGQITDVLKRLGVPKERMVTVMIEPDDWLTKARQESRRLVIAAGLSDDDIDRLIDQARTDVQPQLG
jgi:hypothetical protein